eukprot:TRINITY_DN41281_c0_g1_i1.p1 TRINITY_DN41281_c0_g1~~TRINITY_DN41281_c0_g1_i1.p1  ORF type:complete len:838 (+),score=125.47 TRINITY_DN41281_c0_g1_i1:317-2515(+)
MDNNRDGQLSKTEACTFFAEFGISMSRARDIFSLMDVDGSGCVGIEEWRKAWEELAVAGNIATMIESFSEEALNEDDVQLAWRATDTTTSSPVARLFVKNLVQVRDEFKSDDFEETSRNDLLDAFIRANTRAETRIQQGRMSAFTMRTSRRDEIVADGQFLPKALHPYSRARILWDALSSVAVLADIVLLPISLCISTILWSPEIDHSVCFATSVFWTVDMMMSFFTGYSEGGVVEQDLKKGALKYVRSWFVYDLVILLVEWTTFFFDATRLLAHGQQALRSNRVLRFLRVIRAARLVKVAQTMGKMESTTTSASVQTAFGVFKLAMGLLLLVHFLACGWFAAGAFSGGWASDVRITSQDTLFKYVACIRWTLAQINGRTDQKEGRPLLEMMYTAMCAVFAIMCMSYFVSSMTTRLMDLQALMAKEHLYLQVLQTYDGGHKLSLDTVRMCKRYIRDQLCFEGEADAEKSLLQMLPRQAQLDLLFEVRQPVMCNHPYWGILVSKHFTAGRSIIAEATDSVLTRGLETVFEKGMLRDEMLFVESGHLVYSRQKKMKPVLFHAFRRAEEKERLSSKISSAINFRWRSKRASRKTNEGWLGSEDLQEMSWVSEAALWARSWCARGDLISKKHSRLIRIGALDIIRILNGYEELLSMTSLYARRFIAHVQNLVTNGEDSDLIDLDMDYLFGVDELDHAGCKVAQRTLDSHASSNFSSIVEAYDQESKNSERSYTTSL